MKKLLSILLVASLLAVSVACMFAVSADEDNVVFDFLAAVKEADTADAKIVRNANGSITITLKRDVTAEAPVVLATYTDVKVDLFKQTYFAADFTSKNGAETDFHATYARTDKDAADLFFSGAVNNPDNVRAGGGEGETYIVWDFSNYLGARRIEGGNPIKDFAIVKGSAGDEITINTYAFIDDVNAMTVGTPLVGGNTNSGNDNNTTSESSTSSEASTSSTPSSTTPPTGDAGLIVFAVLGVLAVVGGAVAVRARH